MARTKQTARLSTGGKGCVGYKRTFKKLDLIENYKRILQKNPKNQFRVNFNNTTDYKLKGKLHQVLKHFKYAHTFILPQEYATDNNKILKMIFKKASLVRRIKFKDNQCLEDSKCQMQNLSPLKYLTTIISQNQNIVESISTRGIRNITINQFNLDGELMTKSAILNKLNHISIKSFKQQEIGFTDMDSLAWVLYNISQNCHSLKTLAINQTFEFLPEQVNVLPWQFLLRLEKFDFKLVANSQIDGPEGYALSSMKFLDYVEILHKNDNSKTKPKATEFSSYYTQSLSKDCCRKLSLQYYNLHVLDISNHLRACISLRVLVLELDNKKKIKIDINSIGRMSNLQHLHLSLYNYDGLDEQSSIQFQNAFKNTYNLTSLSLYFDKCNFQGYQWGPFSYAFYHINSLQILKMSFGKNNSFTSVGFQTIFSGFSENQSIYSMEIEIENFEKSVYEGFKQIFYQFKTLHTLKIALSGNKPFEPFSLPFQYLPKLEQLQIAYNLYQLSNFINIGLSEISQLSMVNDLQLKFAESVSATDFSSIQKMLKKMKSLQFLKLDCKLEPKKSVKEGIVQYINNRLGLIKQTCNNLRSIEYNNQLKCY